MHLKTIQIKIVNNYMSYVFDEKNYFNDSELEKLCIFQENSNKCIIVNYQIKSFVIRNIDETTIEVYLKNICDLVFDFEINKNPEKSELICDGNVICNNILNIKYENAFPIVSAGCNFTKLRLYFKEKTDSKNITVKCKYGIVPLKEKELLKKQDVVNEDWIFL